MAISCLNQKYSTTRRVTQERPVIEKNPDDKFETVLFLPEGEGRKGEGGLRTQEDFKASETDKPLITIITVVFNGEQFLEETILSVINQSYDNVEYIIIDGGSIDGTLDIIHKYEQAIDYWVSEKDKGISDAFNKGVRLCLGSIIGIINADDFYERNVLADITSSYLKTEVGSKSIIYGNTYKVTTDGIKTIKNNNKISWCVSVPFSHCSSFTTMTYYKKFGLFNTEFKIGMDVDLLMRGLKSAHYIEIDNYIATQRDGGVSDINRLDGYKEYRSIAKSHFGLILSYLGYLIKVMVFYKNKVFK